MLPKTFTVHLGKFLLSTTSFIQDENTLEDNYHMFSSCSHLFLFSIVVNYLMFLLGFKNRLSTDNIQEHQVTGNDVDPTQKLPAILCKECRPSCSWDVNEYSGNSMSSSQFE